MTGLVVIATGELVEAMTRVEAERITARITDKLDAIADNLDQVMPLIREALTRGAWHALGYASPTAYVSERFAGALTRLPRDVRRPVVAELSGAGMSTRAIAPIVSVGHKTVARDLKAAGVSHDTPASETREHLNHETGELVPETLDDFQRRVLTDAERTGTRVPLTGPGSVATPRTTGLDGKSYPRPTDCKQPEPALAMPQPPKYGVRRGPAKVLERVTTALSGLVIATEGISDLSTLTDEQADRATADLSKAIRELNRIKNLITKERTK